jgi:predicted RNA methylase
MRKIDTAAAEADDELIDAELLAAEFLDVELVDEEVVAILVELELEATALEADSLLLPPFEQAAVMAAATVTQMPKRDRRTTLRIIMVMDLHWPLKKPRA